MKKLIEGFPAQLEISLELAGKFIPQSSSFPSLRNVVIVGLGGSAFGAEVVRKIAEDQSHLPINILRSYSIPAYVSPETLVIISSYSGNTEETLEAFEHCLKQKSRIVCFTSGGKVETLAKQNSLDLILIPKGFPPRSAVGISIVQLLQVLHSYRIIKDFKTDLLESIQLLKDFKDHEIAETIAKELEGKIPVLYSSDLFEPAAIRWRQQINENSKQLCWHHTVPEMNHNELVGWMNPESLMKSLKVIILRSSLDYDRTAMRFEINKNIISKSGVEISEVHGKGKSLLSQLLYLIHFGDWVSLYLAKLNQVDPTPVSVIDFLKGELAKH